MSIEQNEVGGSEVAKKAARKYITIGEMQGSRKTLRIIAVAFAFCLAIACCIWSVYRLVALGFGDPELRYLASFAVGMLGLLPLLLERIFKFNLSNFVYLLLLTFLLLAGFIGSGIGMYPKWAWFHYDKITHGVFGYIGCVAGLFIICKLANYKVTSAVLVVIVCFSVSMACGAVWEIYEFSTDRFLGSTAQGIKIFEGYSTVKDTMLDVIANFFGALVFLAHFIVHRASGKNLGMGSMINDFIDN